MVRLVLQPDSSQQGAPSQHKAPDSTHSTNNAMSARQQRSGTRGSAKDVPCWRGRATCQPKTGAQPRGPRAKPQASPRASQGPRPPPAIEQRVEGATEVRTGNQGTRGFSLGSGAPPREHGRRTRENPKEWVPMCRAVL